MAFPSDIGLELAIQEEKAGEDIRRENCATIFCWSFRCEAPDAHEALDAHWIAQVVLGLEWAFLVDMRLYFMCQRTEPQLVEIARSQAMLFISVACVVCLWRLCAELIHVMHVPHPFCPKRASKPKARSKHAFMQFDVGTSALNIGKFLLVHSNVNRS